MNKITISKEAAELIKGIWAANTDSLASDSSAFHKEIDSLVESKKNCGNCRYNLFDGSGKTGVSCETIIGRCATEKDLYSKWQPKVEKSCRTCRYSDKDHYMSYTRTYKAWRNLKNRCNGYSKSHKLNYKDKGITYCSEWENFEAFFKDMGEAPKGHDLDRRNNQKGYYKENCRWVKRGVNITNRKRCLGGTLPRGVAKFIGKHKIKYIAQIGINNDHYYLGLFDTPEEAHEQYLIIYKEWYGNTPPKD